MAGFVAARVLSFGEEIVKESIAVVFPLLAVMRARELRRNQRKLNVSLCFRCLSETLIVMPLPMKNYTRVESRNEMCTVEV